MSTAENKRKKNVILKRECIQQIEFLKNKSEIISPECRKLSFPDGIQSFSIKFNASACRLIKCGKDVKESGLA